MALAANTETHTVNEAARILGVKPDRLYQAMKRGRIEPRKSVRVLNYTHHYITLEDAQRYLREAADRRRSNVKAS